jgi:general stress protein 26
MTTTLQELSQDKRRKMYEFLKQHPVGVIATVDPEGNPHASTIYFGIDDQLNITFTTKRDTNKHLNITEHSQVMLVVNDVANQATLQASGKAVEVSNTQEAIDIFQDTVHAAQKTGEDVVPPIAKISAGPYVAYKISPDNIWMTEYSWGNSFVKALEHADDPETTEDPA